MSFINIINLKTNEIICKLTTRPDYYTTINSLKVVIEDEKEIIYYLLNNIENSKGALVKGEMIKSIELRVTKRY